MYALTNTNKACIYFFKDQLFDFEVLVLNARFFRKDGCTMNTKHLEHLLGDMGRYHLILGNIGRYRGDIGVILGNIGQYWGIGQGPIQVVPGQLFFKVNFVWPCWIRCVTILLKTADIGRYR